MAEEDRRDRGEEIARYLGRFAGKMVVFLPLAIAGAYFLDLTPSQGAGAICLLTASHILMADERESQAQARTQDQSHEQQPK